MNQGAWHSNQHRMIRVLERVNSNFYLRYCGRPASSAPACGYHSMHLEEMHKFISSALDTSV